MLALAGCVWLLLELKHPSLDWIKGKPNEKHAKPRDGDTSVPRSRPLLGPLLDVAGFVTSLDIGRLTALWSPVTGLSSHLATPLHRGKQASARKPTNLGSTMVYVGLCYKHHQPRSNSASPFKGVNYPVCGSKTTSSQCLSQPEKQWQRKDDMPGFSLVFPTSKLAIKQAVFFLGTQASCSGRAEQENGVPYILLRACPPSQGAVQRAQGMPRAHELTQLTMFSD